MDEMLALVISLFLLLALVPLYLWKRRQDTRSTDLHVEERQAPRRENVVRGGATGGRTRMRRRPAAGGASTSSAATAEETADGSEGEEEEDGNYEAKASKKKEKKRQERDAQRRADEAARESRQTKQDRYSEMRRKKDEEREAEERRLEEEAKARKAKEEEDAALEFEKWKGAFSVDAEGTTENELQDGSQDLLSNFVEYIKNHKCIPLEDLAAEFKLRTQECINRIASLESMGRLSGVMDDRGKYIYISMDEMQAVADYIKRQGRVSIAHLASKSNQFIDLEPKVQFVEEISTAEEIANIPKIVGSGPSLCLLGLFDQPSFMSDPDVQIPSAFDPFADANAEDSGAVAKDYVHIRIQQRNGRKSLTTVQGLKKEFSYNKILKDLKKEFCCNGTVVQDPELGQVIQLQGDQRKNVSTFLVQAGIVKKENIKIHGF
ncbi:hypothetical protein GQ457_01G005680 [Hibiscus cannabinus]